MNHFLLTLLLFFFSIGLNAQNNSSSSRSAQQANNDYFSVPRETLYLHLDKSTYITGEEIWFKGYAYDRQNNLPSFGSTNLNVQLFNQEGKELYSGLFFGSRGNFRGNIKIDSTWNNGSYYLRASTNWMNNFIEDESYIKKIEIIKESISKEIVTEKLRYDFQLLPEGGYLVSDTDNSIGFKLINNRGYGVHFDKGYVVDDQENRIVSFVSNRFGMGKFNIHLRLGKKYKAVIQFKNGEKIQVPFPQIQTKGIAINVDNMPRDYALIEFNTNTKTLEDLNGDHYYLLVKQNHLSKKIPLHFLPNELKRRISLKRDVFYPGINTLTVFKEKTPIAERLLFNSFDKIVEDISASGNKTIKDSLSINIKVPAKKGVRYDLSISVLPEGTKSNNPNDNIYSAMVLRPYLKGLIENEIYYFTDVDRKKRYDLDLLLITQGWSKYSWKRIFNNKPNILYGFNQGYKLKGKIQGKNKDDIYKLYMHPTIYQKGHFIDVDNTNSFELPNFFPEKGEEIKLSGVTSDDVFVEPRLYLQILLDQHKKPLNDIVISQQNNIESKNINKSIKIPKGFIADNIEVLDEVLLKAKSKEESENTSKVPLLKYIKNNSKKITPKIARDFPVILDYIKSVGRFYIRDQRPVTSDVVIYSRAPSSINFPTQVPVFVDNVELRGDKSILTVLRTNEVDRIYIDKISYGLGARGGAGASIRIFTRKVPLGSKIDVDENSVEYTMEKGFEPVKEFYNPGYSNYLDLGFIDYGLIHWQPWVDFNKDGFGTFKIKNTNLENITLFIEGMGSDGSLISKIQTIRLN